METSRATRLIGKGNVFVLLSFLLLNVVFFEVYLLFSSLSIQHAQPVNLPHSGSSRCKVVRCSVFMSYVYVCMYVLNCS